MRVLTIAMVRDEADLVPYFVRHYMQAGDVTLFDDGSVDDTASAARAEGAVVRPVDDPADLDVEYRLLRAKNHAWKPVRGVYDWVIAVDVDEFLWHEDWPGFLARARDRGATVLRPRGYQMVAHGPPRSRPLITEEVRRGVPHQLSSKLCCFDPGKIIDINFDVGSHPATTTPIGEVQFLSDPGLKLLHYHYLGVDWVMARYANRLRQRDGAPPQPHWRHYVDTREQVAEVIARLEAEATEVV